MTVLSFSALVYQFIDALRYPEAERGVAVIMALIAFFGSLNLLAIAILGEYLIKTAEEAKRRPKFIRKAIRWGQERFSTAAEIEVFLRARSQKTVSRKGVLVLDGDEAG